MRKQVSTFAAAVIVSATLGACGSKAPKPNSELALAGSALKSAEQSGARELAPIELRLAREKQDAANQAVENKQYGKARYLTVEARVDAELARAAADAQKSRLELKRAQNNIEVLGNDTVPASNKQ